MALACAAQAEAATTLDPASRASLRRSMLIDNRNAFEGRHSSLVPRHSSLVTRHSSQVALVKLKDGETAEALTADGFDAAGLRGGFAVVTCNVADAERLAAHPAVSRCEFNRRQSHKLNLAREAAGVVNVHDGIGFESPFTGKGVVAGIVDGGFDPNHVNFKDADGNCRIKYFSTVEINSLGTGVRVTPYTTEQLAYFTTDDNTQTHGTHTLGIMAGSFNGEAVVGTYDHETDQTEVGVKACPFYGVAPESTIYASSGSSYDALIAYAIDGILQHRWDNDHYAPVVINLSLGGNSGPHDGSGLLCQFIDAVTESDGAVFCIASGNEGDLPIALNKTFTADDDEVATFIRPYVYTNLRYGMVELYSDTDRDFDVSIIIYNNKRGRVARTVPLNNKEGQIQYICSGEDYVQDDTDIVDATFAKAYNGYVGIAGLVDEDSGRFKAVIDYYTVNSDSNPADDNTEAQYTLGFLVKGHDGQRVDCFCDGTFTALDSYGYAGYTDGQRNGSISDIATARSAIAVGSYNTRVWASNIEGNPIGYGSYFSRGDVTDFSSYGSLVDGRDLPHVLAPGCTVVSSISTPYVNNADNGVSTQTVSAVYNDSQRNHYYQPMMGTSMASPMAAGVVALMLEANPDLTAEQVRQLLMDTAVVDERFEAVEDPVQYGAGRIDAYEAVKAAISSSGLYDVKTDAVGTMINAAGAGTWRVFIPGASRLTATLHSLDGRMAATKSVAGEEGTFDFSGVNPGVYILTINQSNSQRILIRN